MDLSSALKILKSATAESLKNHHREVLETLADLESRLNSGPFSDIQFTRESIGYERPIVTSEAPDLPGYSSRSESESCESSTTSNSSLETPGSETFTSIDNPKDVSSCHYPQPDISVESSEWCEKLLTTIGDDIRWLLDYSTGISTTRAIRNKRNEAKDERVADIQRIDGKRLPSNEDKVFRAFAQRSMGIELTQLQRDAGLRTRVDELSESICSSDPKVRARIQRRTNFATKHLDTFRHAPIDRDVVLRGINAGVKRLTMEKLFAQRLRESNRPIEPGGLSVLTALKITAFDRLLYRDFPCFLDRIFCCEVNLSGSHTSDEPNTASVKLPDILVKLSPWVQDFQDNYDKGIFQADNDLITDDEATPYDGQRPSKRRRLSHLETMQTHVMEDGDLRCDRNDPVAISTSSEPELSRQSVQSVVDFSTEVTEGIGSNQSICQGPELSRASESTLPMNHLCTLGNWDKDYNFVATQNTQTPAGDLFWQNGNSGEGSFSDISEQRLMSGCAPWGNWDQDYHDVTSNVQAQRNLTTRGPWGNWDQDYDVMLSGAEWTSPSMFYCSS